MAYWWLCLPAMAVVQVQIPAVVRLFFLPDQLWSGIDPASCKSHIFTDVWQGNVTSRVPGHFQVMSWPWHSMVVYATTSPLTFSWPSLLPSSFNLKLPPLAGCSPQNRMHCVVLTVTCDLQTNAVNFSKQPPLIHTTFGGLAIAIASFLPLRLTHQNKNFKKKKPKCLPEMWSCTYVNT